MSSTSTIRMTAISTNSSIDTTRLLLKLFDGMPGMVGVIVGWLVVIGGRLVVIVGRLALLTVELEIVKSSCHMIT